MPTILKATCANPVIREPLCVNLMTDLPDHHTVHDSAPEGATTAWLPGSCAVTVDLASGEMTIADAQIFSLTGYPDSHFTNISDLFDLAVMGAGPMAQQFLALSDGRDHWQMEFRIYTAAADVLWLQAIFDRVLCPATGRQLLQGRLADISQPVQTSQTDAVLLEVVASSANEVYVIDAQSLRLVYVNNLAMANLQLTTAMVNELVITDIAPAATVAEVARWQIPLGRDGIDYLRTDLVQYRSDGTSYTLRTTLTVSPEQPGYLVSIGADLSGRLLRRQRADVLRKRYERALAGTETAVWEWDMGSGAFVITSAVNNWLGLGADDPGITSVDEVRRWMHKDDLERFNKVVQLSEQTEKPFVMEFRFMSADGQIVWVEARGSLMFDTNGVSNGMSGTLNNITRRKHDEQAISGALTQLKAVLDGVADGIVTLDDHGVVQTVNHAGEKVLGREKTFLVGAVLVQLLDFDGKILVDWAGLADGKQRECHVMLTSGRTFPGEFTVSHSKVANATLYTLVVRNITERKLFEHELVLARDEARAAAAAKSEFLATMSHEIRTPMTGILGMTQQLLETQMTAEQQASLNIIHNSGATLLKIINDILDYSRIEAGKFVIDHQPFDLRESIKAVMVLVQAGQHKDNVTLLLDYSLSLPSRFVGDPGRIRQILLNLVGNALKFTREGHVVVKVESITDLPCVGSVRVSVSDSGIGVPVDRQPTLFSLFSQADGSIHQKYGGSGLGLAISRQLVEMMGGEISFNSVADKGSVFWFSLDLEAPAAQPLMAATGQLIGQLIGQQVMLCLKDQLQSQLLGHMLAELGAEVVIIATEAEALACVRATPGRWQLLLDQRYGLDFCVAVRAALASLPSEVVCTLLSTVGAGVRQRFIEAGFHHFLAGPVTHSDLSHLIGDRPPVPVTGSAGPGTPEAGTNAGQRILVAEDNRVNQLIIERILVQAGYSVELVADGLLALERLDSTDYELLLMDCQMPGLDGLAATRQIREREARAGNEPMPILALTANVLPEQVAECLAAGMDDVLAKPIDNAHLLAQVARWCKSR